MALLPKMDDIDPTLEAADKALADEYNKQPRRGYLGMSSVGDKCSRKSWYRFRFAKKEKFSADTIKKFIDGFDQEEVQAKRLQSVPGLKLITHTEDGKQIEFSWFNGYFLGHMDGEITGLLQAPATPHSWENKSVNEKKFEKLKKLKEEKGEKNAFRLWDEIYYSQSQLYMHFGGYSRSYLTVNTPGGRDWVSCRTDYDKDYALMLIEKAEYIIFSEDAPRRLNDNPSWFECKWCSFHDICHSKVVPEVNCRTCLHSTPERDGTWSCAKMAMEIKDTEQMSCGGKEHLFLPGMLDGKIKTVENGAVIYEDGRINYCGGVVQ